MDGAWLGRLGERCGAVPVRWSGGSCSQLRRRLLSHWLGGIPGGIAGV